MRFLLHGDDTASSRKYLGGLVEGYKTAFLAGKTLTAAFFEEQLASESLFSEKKAVVVENLLSQNAKKKEFISFLNSSKSQTLLILWEEKKLSKAAFASLKDFKVQEFLLPTYYFQFLDSFAPQNKKKTFELYHKLLATYAPEQLLFSLIKRIRLLLLLSNDSKAEEIVKLAPWMRSKLVQQQRLWGVEMLASFYQSLQDAEIKLKTGKLPVDLSKHLDILILSKL